MTPAREAEPVSYRPEEPAWPGSEQQPSRKHRPGSGGATRPGEAERARGRRLAAIAGVQATRLKGQTIASIADKLRWEIDPELLLFRRVCGRVVKTDPVTGIQYPVPFATVHVLDTDCDFWGYFPEGWLFAWLFRIRCHFEELAHVVTDECGNFCVWIPRFEIDWILRWRRERFCFEEFLVKPSIADLLLRLAEEVELDRPFPLGPRSVPDRGGRGRARGRRGAPWAAR